MSRAGWPCRLPFGGQGLADADRRRARAGRVPRHRTDREPRDELPSDIRTAFAVAPTRRFHVTAPPPPAPSQPPIPPDTPATPAYVTRHLTPTTSRPPPHP